MCDAALDTVMQSAKRTTAEITEEMEHRRYQELVSLRLELYQREPTSERSKWDAKCAEGRAPGEPRGLVAQVGKPNRHEGVGGCGLRC